MDPTARYYQTTLTIGPPFTIKSNIPIPLKLRVYCLQSTKQDPLDPSKLQYAEKEPRPDKLWMGTLRPNGTLPVHKVVLDENIFVEMGMINTNDSSSPIQEKEKTY